MSKAIKSCKQKKTPRPILLIVLGIIIFACAIIAHPWDLEWQHLMLKYSYLTAKGTSLRSLLTIITTFGKGTAIALFIIITAAIGFRKSAIKMFVTIIIMSVIVWSLKLSVQRERPNHRNHVSFPSGDTATASAFLGITAVEFPSLAPAYIIAPAVGFLRTYANWHYLSDVIAGLGCGLIACGIAYYIKFKKLKLLEKIKPRYYAIAAIVLALACFIPDVIKNGGSFLDFFELYGPPLMILLASGYSLLFVLKPSAKDNLFSRIFRIKRAVNNYIYRLVEKKLKTFLFNKITSGIIIIISFILLYYSCAIIYFQKMRLSTAGIAFGLLTALFIIWRQNRKTKNSRTAIQTLINSAFITVLFCLITFVPSIFRNQHYYTKKGKSNLSIIYRITH